VEIRRPIAQVDQDLHLLHKVAAALAVKYDDQELADLVDALADDLNRAVIAATIGRQRADRSEVAP
jgi:hypothetical protein